MASVNTQNQLITLVDDSSYKASKVWGRYQILSKVV